jgi:hypothetical protein
LDNSNHVLVEYPPAYLQDDWLTDQEREDKYCQDHREMSIHNAQLQRDQPRRDPPHIASPQDIIPNEHVMDAPKAFYDAFQDDTSNDTVLSSNVPQVLPPPVPTDPVPERRSTRINTGQRTTPQFHDVFLSQASIFEQNNGHANLVYLAKLTTDMDSGDVDIIDPRVYAAKNLKNDPHSPNMHQSMHGDFVEQYTDAMKSEIASLIQQKTWTPIPRADASRVIKNTWVFKLKLLPDGTSLKFKARLCVRGD